MDDMTPAEGAGVGMSGASGGGLALDAPPSTEDYQVGKLEQRGIELIPESDRKMRPAGLFWMWAGAMWNVEFLVYGALIVSSGSRSGKRSGRSSSATSSTRSLG